MKAKDILLGFVKVGLTIILLLLLLYASIRLGSIGYDFGYRVFTEQAVDAEPGTDILIQVQDSMSSLDVAKMLEEKGLVRDGYLFYLQLRLSVYSSDLQPGMYTLNTSMDAKEMMRIMAHADEEDSTEEDTEEEEKVTIPTDDSDEEFVDEMEDIVSEDANSDDATNEGAGE